MKYRNPKFMFVTGSVKGTSHEESVIYETTKYYYVKIIKDGKTFYYGNNGTLGNQYNAVTFTERNALKIREALSRKYPDVQIFGTTKKLC